ncbi:hypothetical protein U91I_02252 [alpha proteobacterium U9-1i]|nr:hypothetical protein U91I_02252 [alpha proteobacterium U9-1i]
MTKQATIIAGLGALIAATTLISSALADPPPAPMMLSQTSILAASLQSTVRGVPVNELPREGQCRIWYDELPANVQPAASDCEHAHWVAQRWGGRVISSTAEEADYEGRNDFTGVPASALPRPGYCRVWLDTLPAHRQAAESDCRAARTVADRVGGRVIHIPL